MKIIIKETLVVFLSAFTISVNICHAQEIVVKFVAPYNVISKYFSDDLVSTNCPRGFAVVDLTSFNVSKFNEIAPPNIKYVYEQLQPGTDLRNYLNHVFKNSNGKVNKIEYWLIDDVTSLSETQDSKEAGIFTIYTDRENNKKYVWPTASNFESIGNFYTGRVRLGEHQLASDQSNRPGKKSIGEVVLHESSHTQLLGMHKWDGFGDYAITYNNASHFSRSELLADQESALDEGLATYYGLIINDDGLKKLIDSYSITDYRYIVETKSALGTQPELYSAPNKFTKPLVITLRNGTKIPRVYEDGKEILVTLYGWMDVPGWYLLFNAWTTTLFFSTFRNMSFADKDLTTSMIQFTVQDMSGERKKRFLTYACNRLSLKMEEYNKSDIGITKGDRISSLFPFAILDLITHFGMTDDQYQADYNRNNADKDPKAYSEYFSRRASIKELVQADINASPIRFQEALEKIIKYCRQPVNIF